MGLTDWTAPPALSLLRLGAARRRRAVWSRCQPKDCRHGLHPTRVGGAAVSLPRCFAVSLPRCLAASLLRRRFVRCFASNTVWWLLIIGEVFARCSLFVRCSLLRCFVASLFRCFAASLPRYFAVSLPRCLAASPPFRSLFRFEYSVVAADNWRGVCSVFAVRSLFAASLLRCFAVSLPRCLAASLFRCLAASLPRCLAASLPRCLAASPHPHPIFHNCLSTAYWTLCNG